MSGVNKVIIVGRLGQDPEMRSTATGRQVCTLNVATSESWVKDGNREERTEWHRIILWDKLAELASRFLKKGRMVYIEGKLQTRSWQDQQGQKRYTTEIIGNTMQFIDSQRDQGDINAPSSPTMADPYFSRGGTYEGGGNEASFPQGNRVPDDDIPF